MCMCSSLELFKAPPAANRASVCFVRTEELDRSGDPQGYVWHSEPKIDMDYCDASFANRHFAPSYSATNLAFNRSVATSSQVGGHGGGGGESCSLKNPISRPPVIPHPPLPSPSLSPPSPSSSPPPPLSSLISAAGSFTEALPQSTAAGGTAVLKGVVKRTKTGGRRRVETAGLLCARWRYLLQMVLLRRRRRRGRRGRRGRAIVVAIIAVLIRTTTSTTTSTCPVGTSSIYIYIYILLEFVRCLIE